MPLCEYCLKAADHIHPPCGHCHGTGKCPHPFCIVCASPVSDTLGLSCGTCLRCVGEGIDFSRQELTAALLSKWQTDRS